MRLTVVYVITVAALLGLALYIAHTISSTLKMRPSTNLLLTVTQCIYTNSSICISDSSVTLISLDSNFCLVKIGDVVLVVRKAEVVDKGIVCPGRNYTCTVGCILNFYVDSNGELMLRLYSG